jgi:SAM-dependent methyltransferase
MNQWGKKNVVDFYINNRNKVSDLYPSEKIPLKKIDKKRITKIMDFGCAVGGFYKIFTKFFHNRIIYYGYDTEMNVINEAKTRYKKNKRLHFIEIDRKKKKISSKKFSLVFCTGVLNHNKNYKLIIKELIRCSSKYVFIDSPRVHLGKSFIGKLNLTKRFPSKIKKDNVVNNLTVNFEEYLIFLKKVFKENKIKNALFYSDYLPYKKKYLKINKKISFLTFSCSKLKKKKNEIKFLCKNSEMKEVFNKIFG